MCDAALGWTSAEDTRTRSPVCTPRTSDAGRSEGGLVWLLVSGLEWVISKPQHQFLR